MSFSLLSGVVESSVKNKAQYLSDPNITLMDKESPLRQATVHGSCRLIEVSDSPRMTGGYGDIYHGFWENSQGKRFEVAVKELRAPIPRNQATYPDELSKTIEIRLAREAYVWSRIHHRNLHPLLDYQSEPRPRLISPWCRHGNLLDYLKANATLSRVDKLRLIYQAAYGLEHLHSRTPPISHADIKPENVLINDWREATLSDFGLSRVLHGLDVPSGFTTSEIAKGTLNYMAAELFAGEKPTCNSDVYAFGGLILTVMSGKSPFCGLPEPTILFRVMQDRPPRPEDHPYLPQSDPVWSLMRRCWDPNPTARPSMRRVLWELWEYICQENSESRPRPSLLSVTEGSSGEDSATDLDTSDAAQQEGGSSSTIANPVLGQGPLSSIHGAEGVCSSIARESFSPALDIFKTLEVKSKTIPVFGKYIRAAVEVGFLLMGVVKAIDRNQDIANALESSVWRLAVFLERLREKSSDQTGDEVGACLDDIKQELASVQRQFEGLYSSGAFPKALSCCDHNEGRKKWEEATWKTWETMQLLSDLDTATLVAEPKNGQFQGEHRRLLNCLGDGKYGARGNAVEDVLCLPGTRVEVLERIDSWVRETTSSRRVLLIRGMAGRGKSTIASTVAHNWQYRASCALFHFRRGQNALNCRIVCALARQLASSLVPGVRNAVLESVRENEDISDQRLSVQFETLLVAPLSTLKNLNHPVLIVVDALDECENPKDAVDFVKLIDRHSSTLPINVKFLLTCRPEVVLLRTLESRRWQVEDLDSSPDVVNDLAHFFKQAFERIKDDHGLSENWPSHRDVGRLVEMSQGLFQWACTAITYIGSRSPVSRLQDLLERSSIWSGLDDLYHQILSKAVDNIGLDPSRRDLLSQILGILVVAPHPVSLEVLTALCRATGGSIGEGASQEDITQFLRQDILMDLHSLLLIPTSSSEPLCLMHNSIRDFLASEQRCKDRAYYIDITEHHERIAGMCLRIMVQCLKKNICNLSDTSKPNSEIQDTIDREVSSTVRYCCRSWSIHLTQGTRWSRLRTDGSNSLGLNFEVFSKEKVLYWLEVMSVVGATTEAMATAKRVHQWLLQCPTELPELDLFNNLWSDIQRFIAAFSEPISFGASHIYVSALTHCPQQTTLWSWYGKHAKIQAIRGVRQTTWPPNLWTRSTGAPVAIIAFSPDSATLASGSEDATIRLWDAHTGTPLGEPLTAHNDCVNSVVFSPDGKSLASGSDDGTIRLWDSQTGAPLGEQLTGHHGRVSSVTFSPDGKLLASGSGDGTIRLWEIQTGTPLGEPLAGHNCGVLSVAFSPDGKVLASGSDDGAIRLWDTETGMPLIEPLRCDGEWVNSVVFSPDGKVLASGSGSQHEYGAIRLWDTQTGTPLGEPLTGHHDCVNSVVFSPDGKALASGLGFHSDQGAIQLWDVHTGKPLGEPLTGHHGCVNSVAFSPDGKVLASGSSDNTIRLWDAQTGAPLNDPLTCSDRSVGCVAFSPDGTVLASGSGFYSNDGAIQLWDIKTGTCRGQPLTGHHNSVISVVFSPDGKVLASGSGDGTIRLWDTQTWAPLGDPLTSHDGRVWPGAFSPGGKLLASASLSALDRSTTRLLDHQTGTRLGEVLTAHDAWVDSIVFSSDGQVLASGSGDGTIRLWNTQNGTPLGELLTGHHGRVSSVAFSPNGKVLASGSGDGTVQLWDTQTRTPLGEPLTGHDGRVNFVAFSSDGKILESQSHDGPTRAWDANTGAPLTKPRRGDINIVSFVPFAQAVSQTPDTLPWDLLQFHDHWIISSSSRLLWLPPQYWADQSPVILLSNGSLVIVSNGHLSIFFHM